MEILERLREELSELLDAIQCAGEEVVLEELPGPLGDVWDPPLYRAARRGVEESGHGPAVCAPDP